MHQQTNYKIFITMSMIVLLQNQLHEHQFQHWWSAQDGVPCHGLMAVFGERVLSLHSSTKWSRRSPDLTSCDCFLLRLFLNYKVFRTPSRKSECTVAKNNNWVKLNERKQRFNKKICTAHEDFCWYLFKRVGGYVEGNLSKFYKKLLFFSVYQSCFSLCNWHFWVILCLD